MPAMLMLVALATANVSIDLGALPAGKAIPKLGQALGTELRVEARLGNEVLMVVGRDVPRDELLDRVARVLRAKWERDAKGLILRRPAEVQRALEREARERRLARFTPIFRRNRAFLNELPSLDGRADAVVKSLHDLVERERTGRREIVNGGYEAKYLSPAKILMRQILDRLGPQELADIPGGAVYAQTPTRAQRRVDMRPFLEEYRQTQERIAVGPQGIEGLEPYVRDSVFGPPRRTPSMGKVLFRTYITGGTLIAVVLIYGTDGKRIDAADLREQFDPGVNIAGMTESAALKKALATDGPRAPLSKLAADVVAVYPDDPDGLLPDPRAETREVPASVRAAVANPEEVEPLSLAASDAVRGLAGTRAIVACLPDSTLRYAHLAADRGEVRLGAFEAMAQDLGDVEFVREGNWLQVRPNDPLRDAAARTSRKVLGEFLRNAVKKREFTIRDFAVYKHRADGRDANPIDRLYAQIEALAGTKPVWSYSSLSGAVWRVLGSLPDAAWSALLAGERLEVGRLAEVRNRIPEWARYTGERTPDAAGERATDLWLQVSECAPNGVPGNATLRLETDSQDVIQRVPSTYTHTERIQIAHQPTPLREVAELIEDLAHEAKDPDPASLLIGRYWRGSQGFFRLSLHLAEGVQVTQSLPLRPELAGGNGVPWAELPSSVREAMNRHLQELAKRRAAGGSFLG
ncbi:MAG: hypothetical protein ACO1SV_24220 [Fimbriimonas sp.]